jgi:hypothetical protein
MDSRSCPQCGASVRVVEDDDFATCAFCGSSLHLGGEQGIAHDLLLPVLSAKDVGVPLARWVAGREALGRPVVTDSRLLFLPFWAIQEGGGTRLVPAAPPLSARPPMDFSIPAGDLQRFHLEAVAGATVVESTLPLRALVGEGSEPPSGTRLLHLPFWETSYRVLSAQQVALVDAVGGAVLPLSYPASSGERWLDFLHAVVMVALLVVVFRVFREIFWFGSLLTPKSWHLLVAGPLAWGTLWGASRIRRGTP